MKYFLKDKKMRATIQFMIMVSACFMLFSGVTNEASAKKKKQQVWRYEIEPVSEGVQGTYLIKVWSYSKKSNLAIEQAKKNAVHGIIFRGFAGLNGVAKKPALAGSNTSLEEEKKDFFDDFFSEGGKYMKFVNITNDGSIAAKDRLKVGKEYKLGVIVSVSVEALRKDLESAGIIKKLGAGF
jgi:hypothetical protein